MTSFLTLMMMLVHHTVIASTGMEADSLASAFPVMGLRKTKEYLDKKAGITAYYLLKKDSCALFKVFKSSYNAGKTLNIACASSDLT